MDLTKVMADLDAAVDVVEAKRADLGAANDNYTKVTEAARLKVQAAAKAHTDAVETAQALRRQLNEALNTALPADPGGIQVNR